MAQAFFSAGDDGPNPAMAIPQMPMFTGSNPAMAFPQMPMFTFVSAVPAPGGGMMPMSFLGGGGDAAATFVAEAMNAQGGGGAPRTHPASQAAIRALKSGTCTEASGTPSDPCPVCQEAFATGDQWLRMPCGHFYHGDCLTPWLKEHNTCPTCRQEIEEEAEPPPPPPPPPPEPEPPAEVEGAPPPPVFRPGLQPQPEQFGADFFMHGGGAGGGEAHPLRALLAHAHEQMLAQEEERQLQAALRASMEEAPPPPPPPQAAASLPEPSDRNAWVGGEGGGDERVREAGGSPAPEPERMGVRQLKLLLEQRGVDYSGCVERGDLLALIAQTTPSGHA
eukprot:SAG25_NODE_347_length_9358_cov_86.358315_8_plen_335_part_00